MNIRVILLPFKVAIILGSLFTTSIEQFMCLMCVLLLLVLSPKVGSMINYITHSGYIMAPSGEVYTANEVNKKEAMYRGFRELPVWKSAKLEGDILEWKP